MASANVKLVRSIFAAWERGNFDSVDGLDPEIELVMGDGPMPSASRGLAEMAEAIRQWLEAWDDVRQIAVDYRELDDERVLVLHHFSARGKKSGLELGQIRREGAAVFTILAGKVIRLVHYFDRDLAFAELGLLPTTVRPYP